MLQGATAASPSPTPSRVQNNGMKLRVSAAVAVIAHHSEMPAARIERRLDAIGQPADRQADQHIEDAEGRAQQQADLKVAELEVLLDRGHQQARQEAVDIGDHLRQREQADDVPCVATGRA